MTPPYFPFNVSLMSKIKTYRQITILKKIKVKEQVKLKGSFCFKYSHYTNSEGKIPVLYINLSPKRLSRTLIDERTAFQETLTKNLL